MRELLAALAVFVAVATGVVGHMLWIDGQWLACTLLAFGGGFTASSLIIATWRF